MKTILLCSDLDRTIIPNGRQRESPYARDILHRLAARPELKLAYVSGRNKGLVREAIYQYELPQPDFVIGDVGTTMYVVRAGQFHFDEAWYAEIGVDWNGWDSQAIASLLAEEPGLDIVPQAAAKQNRYKLSYYTAPDAVIRILCRRINGVLASKGIKATVIWSYDETEDCGLLDILPRRANKVQAMRFLVKQHGYTEDRVVFAGDSGNDLDALTSEFRAVLVKNSADEVRREALEKVRSAGRQQLLYLARGGRMNLNGNYSAGVVEGLAHYFPEVWEWVKEAIVDIGDDKGNV